MSHPANTAANYVLEKIRGFKPNVGIVLGSGLGKLVEQIEHPITLPYTEIPGFPPCGVEGHGGALHVGHIQNTPVACLEGRTHYYEGVTNKMMQTPVRLLKLLGCDILFITNSAGSLNPDVPVGSLVAIKDHINLQFKNPLVGPNDDAFGPRFIGMENAYDPALREQLFVAAKGISMPLTEGVFVGVLGPSFETPAEINAFRTLGADVVAMSLIPEVIVARHCGMRVVAISAISNLAAGLHKGALSHEVTLSGAEKSSKNLVALVSKFLT